MKTKPSASSSLLSKQSSSHGLSGQEEDGTDGGSACEPREGWAREGRGTELGGAVR